MNKKYLLISLCILAIVGAALFFMQKKEDVVAGLADLTQSIPKAASVKNLAKDPAYSELNADLLGLFHFSKDNADPLTQAIFTTYTRLAQLSVIHALEQAASGGTQNFPSLPKVQEKMMSELERSGLPRKDVETFFNSFEDLLIAAHNDSFEIQGMKAPKMMFQLRFSDSNIAQKALDHISNWLKNSPPPPGIALVNVSNGLVIQSTMPRFNLGVFQRNGSLVATLGSDKSDAFFSAEAKDSFFASDHWKPISTGVLPKSFLRMFVDTKGFLPYLAHLLAMPDMNVQGVDPKFVLKKIEESLGGAKNASLSFAFNDGIQARSCAQVTESSTLQAQLESLSAPTQAKDSGIAHAISDDTILASRVSGAALTYLIDSQLDNLKTHPSLPPEVQKIAEEFVGVLKKLQAREYGILLEAPTFGFTPSLSFLIHETKAPAPQAFGSLKGLLKKLIEENGGDAGLILNESTNAYGEPQITIGAVQSMMGANLTIGVAGNSILATSDQSKFDSMINAFEAGKSHLQKQNAAGGSAYELYATATKALYINSKPAINMVKPFVPMLNSFKQGDISISQADIEKFLGIIDGQILSLQMTRKIQSDLFCTDQILTGWEN